MDRGSPSGQHDGAMVFLFLHQNFPGQFAHLAPALAAKGHQVFALSSRFTKPDTWRGVRLIPYAYAEPKDQKLPELLMTPSTKGILRGIPGVPERACIISGTFTQDITLTKYVDLASNDLIKRCTSGEHIENGELIVRKSGGTSPVEYFRIKMENIMITSYNTGGSKDGLDRIQETLTLNFRKFEVLYTLQEESGAAGAETMSGWDIAENKEWNA